MSYSPGDEDYCQKCGAHYREPCHNDPPCGYEQVPFERKGQVNTRMLSKAKSALETLSTIAVIVAVAWMLWDRTAQAKPPAPRSPAIEAASGTIDRARLANAQGSGQLAIIEFTDFQCPFCKRHAEQTIPALLKELNGEARYISLDYPLSTHPQAMAAAEAAECAGEQGKFWEMHRTLFAKQDEIKELPDYFEYAKAIGLNLERFKGCLASGWARGQVTADQKLASTLKVTGTPSLFIGRARADGGVDLIKRINGAAPAVTIVAEVAKLVNNGG